MNDTNAKPKTYASTGVPGLDDILRGGLARDRVYLLEGTPGTGKTTAAVQFLLAGAEAGEKGLYITLSETAEELGATAESHGWTFDDKFEVFELIPPDNLLDENQQQSLLYSSDLELGETVRMIFKAIQDAKPKRVVIDSLSEIRLLAGGSLRYRRQILALKHYFSRHNATVLMLDDMTSDVLDKTVHSVAHAVIRLEELAPIYGAERRRLRVVKYRGQNFRGGFHDFQIRQGGLVVFPRLVALEHKIELDREVLGSNEEGLDALLGGGVARGSSTLILGPAGTGKSLLALEFVRAAIRRGEKAAMFVFDEEMSLLKRRALGLGFDLQAMVDAGDLLLEQVDAAELSPGEFTHRVRACLEARDLRTIVIDSLNGYQASMPEEQYLVLHMHELLQFLNRRGATTFLTVAQHGLVGEMKAPVDVTYLADTVILLRYFEATGRVRRAISVIKKRTGRHEDTIREYQIGERGFSVGAVLEGFQGILRGVPVFAGRNENLMPDDAR